jgi:CRP/FNR family transcriptional regulator, dissimilatory nitrate respiration regulator
MAHMIVIMSVDDLSFLHFLPSTERRLAKGTFLFQRDDPVRSLFLVMEGSIELLRRQENGNVLTLQRAEGQSVLAEASLFAERYHCDAIAARDSRLIVLAKTDVLNALAADPACAVSWTAYLSRQVQQARLRSEILSLKTVAERLEMWLAFSGDRPERGRWIEVAGHIGVTPEALYRELAKRRYS